MSEIYFQLLPLLILALAGGLAAGWGVMAPRRNVGVENFLVKSGFGLLGLLGIWVIAITAIQKQLPILTPGQLMFLIATTTWIAHNLMQIQIRQRLLSLLPLLAILILSVAGLLIGLRTPDYPADPLLGFRPAVHVLLSLTGMSLLAGNGVFAAGQLILHHQLKSHHYGAWFERLPSLQEMSRLRSITLLYGWLVITLVAIVAFVWFRLLPGNAHGVVSHYHPMLTFWAITGGLLLAEKRRWLSPRQLATASICLSAVMVTLLTISLIEIFRGRFL